jgi:hypothetical protein
LVVGDTYCLHMLLKYRLEVVDNTELDRAVVVSVHRAGCARHSSNPRGSTENDGYSNEFDQIDGCMCTRKLRAFPPPAACVQAPRAV